MKKAANTVIAAKAPGVLIAPPSKYGSSHPPPRRFWDFPRKIFTASLILAVASATLIAASANPASAQSSASLLSATGCTDGTFVDLAANPRVTGANNDLVEDCQALVAIHNHWVAEPLNRSAFFTSWGDGFSEKISTWYGVTITNKRVTSLGTTYTWTSGTIPPEIGNLSALTSLSLSNHYFTGSIPAELGNLTNLTSLDLSRYPYNRDAIYGEGLSGAIPTQLGNLTALTTLNLIRNQLTGNIPTQLGSLTNLTTLNLAGNRLTGGIPAELGSLTKLNSLALDSNRLTSIPTQLGNLTALTTINLSNNRLTGPIPTQLGSLTALTTLNLSNNRLTGSIPTQLGSLTALTTLNLSNNALSGSIPKELGSLTSLAGDSYSGLDLSHNVLSGNIPSELGNLTKVVYINLSKNLLTGSIPTQLNQLTQMSHLRLNDNQLSGNIPTQLGRLASSQSGSLTAFYICNNSISGNVPTDLRSSIAYSTSQYDPIGCQAASNIAYSAPTGLVVNTGRSITIDASRYVEDGAYNISCRDATGKHSNISSITRDGCVYTITAGSTAAAAATFTVPYTSAGGDTHNGEISIALTSASGTSDISFTAPSPNPAVAGGQSITLNAAAYASDGSYTITCGDATNKHTRIASISRAANSCLFTVTAGATTGSATFTVPYTSSGGDTHNGVVTISIGTASNIVFTPPLNLSVARSRNIVINASSYASDGSYAISCGEAIRVSAIYQSWLAISQNGCSYTVRPTRQIRAAIAIPYTSSGGDTHLGVIFISIGPRSNISFTAPRGLSVAASRSIDIDAAALASDSGGYTLSCSDATNKHAKISTITRNGCTYTVTAGTQTGTATFTVPYTSTGGDTHNSTITITIGPASNITFTAPASNPTVAASRSIDIDAAVLASDSGGYTLSCSDATNKHAKISTITRNGCTYTVTAGTQTGTATFTVPYTSTGGDTHNSTITITIGPASNITFTPPANLTMEAERNLTIDASQYATDGTYAISCYNPRISGGYRFASWRSDGCTYTLVAGTATGSATLIVNYRSSGGDSHRAAITITINPTTTPLGAITALSATGCTDGTFVNLTDYPRVQGTNNDLVEDCQALVAIQNHWAAVSANNSLPANHPLRTWGVGASQKIQHWSGAQTSQYDPSTSTLTYLDRVWLIGLYDQDISGTIPAQFGNLTGLTTVLLRDNKLTGAIPTRLGNLFYLDLSNNRLTGSIPTQLSSLTNLTLLDLSNNRLTGSIPTQLSSLTRLWRLDLSNNRLTGSIPTQLSSLTRLWRLDLSNNRLTGTIPTQLGSLTALSTLNLSNNRLTGTIPTQLGSLTALNRFGVCNNHLSGAVPSSLQSGVLLLGYPTSSGYSTVQCQYSESSAGTAIPALSAAGCTDGTFVDLTANPRVSGTNNDLAEDCQALVAIQNHWAAVSANNNLPASHPLRTWGTGTATEKKTSNWANITITNKRVTTLNLFNPAGSNPGISGSMPAQLGNLTSLTSLNLTNNQLTGSIPTQLGSLTALTNLGLGHNQLTGSIPTQLGSLTSLRSLSLYNNQLSGTIPTQLGSLTALTSLSFGSNGLSGSIPSGLGSLTNLTSLNLSTNQLTGTIPTQLSSLTNLTWLNLSLNKLSGSIPTQLGDLTKLIRLDLGGNRLSGRIPEELGKLAKLMWLDFSNNRLTGSIPIQLANLVPATGTLVKIGRGNLRNLLVCGNYLSGSLPQASLLARTLVGHPSSQPSNSIGCQRPSQIRLTVQFTSVSVSSIPGVSTGLSVPAGRRILIDAGSFVRDGDYSINCADATGATANISSISRNGCRYTVTAGNIPGSAGFTVLYTSSGGGTLSVRAALSIGSTSSTSKIVFSPPSLQLAAGSSRTVGASTYAADGSSTISCADAKDVSSKISITSRSGCSYVVAAQSSAKGSANFTVPYTSTGGDTHDGVFTINISNIAFTTPTGLALTAGSSASISIDASTYVSDGDFAVSCADATSVDSKISVVRHSSPPLDISGSGCTYAITAGSTAGTATFTVPYTSTGGDTHNGIISVTVNAAPTLGSIPALSATGCTDGTFVDLTDNPRVEGTNNDLAEDCQALVAVQNHWAGVAANNSLPADHPLRTWGTGTNKKVTSWQGVTIRTNRVTSLNLNNQTIAGSIPTQLGNLTNLTALRLSSNQLTGSIPSQIGSLTKLVSLNLRNNRLTGSIPAELGSLTKLQGSTFSPGLNLSNNQFTGSIPTQLGNLTELVSLSLSTNQLTGSIPAELGNLTKLTNLTLSNNQLTESIPTQLGNLTKLTNLTLINNRLTGTIPTQLGNLTNLTRLDFSSNRLTGSIPAELGSLTKLTDLNLSNNQLTGSIPTQLASLTKLNRLLLNDNKLSGTIPTALASLAPDTGSLTWMEICRNYLTGAVPTALRTAISSWQVTTYDPIGCQYPGTPSGTAIVALSASGCTDGTFVDLTANPRVEGSNNDLAEDCQALVAIQNHWAAMADNNNLAATHFLRTWGTGTDKKIGTWAKVEISNKRVTSLTLSHTFGTSPSMIGTIPTQLGNLTALTSLSLGSNRLTGSIPAQLGNLTKLTNLNLSGNQLTGNMPTELGNLTNLTNLNLSVNRLSDSIPTQFGNLTKLTILNLTNNRLTGNMPTELGNLTKLTNLNLSVNRLSDSIPTQFGNLTKLTNLGLSSNQLTGNIPTQLGNLTNLTTLNLAGNRLTGGIPAELGSLTKLEGSSFSPGLDLSNNQLTGSIPTQLGQLTKLVSINLANNQLTGSIPAELGNLTKLEGASFNTGLNLSNNQLTGSIPTQLGQLTKLTTLDLSNNQLTGNIPAELGNLTKLEGASFRPGLNLSNNQLTGTIPTQLGQLTKLTNLNLANNQLTGSIPTQLNSLSKLQILILRDNRLTGTIPAELGTLAAAEGSSFNRLDICNNYLTGAVPTALRTAIRDTVSYRSVASDPVGCQIASDIKFSAPTDLSVTVSGSITVDANSYATDGIRNITCADATGISPLITVNSRNGCSYQITAGSTAGTATFTVPYTSSGGDTHSGIISIAVNAVSNIAFNAPTGLSVPAGRRMVIDAASYASDGSYAITCADAASVSASITIQRQGCSYVVTAGSTTGAASFTVPYTSSGGDTESGTISLTIAAASSTSNIVFVAPAGLTVATGGRITVDASQYATDGTATISCADATGVSSLITLQRTNCSYAVTAGSTAGTASFTVPYTSSGGDTHNGAISITVTAASDIDFTAPSGLSVAAGSSISVNASRYAADGSYEISCADAASVSSMIASISRNGCSYSVMAGSAMGTASFTVPYTSSGGDTHNGAISITITDVSDIVYTSPSRLEVNVGRTLTVLAGNFAADGSYSITCSDATRIHSRILQIVRNGCSFLVTVSAIQGQAEFTLVYTSSGGDTHESTIYITVNPSSNITFTAPTGLSVAAQRSIVIDASEHAEDGPHRLSCGTATNVNARITVSAPEGCSYTVTAGSTQGTASFTVPYTSSGGDTETGTISVTIGPPSNIVYTAPTGLIVGRNRSLTIDAGSYVTENAAYTVSCADATGVDSTRLTSVTRGSWDRCSYTIDPIDSLAQSLQGSTNFTIPYNSTGGDTHEGVVSVTVGPDSLITYTAPSPNPRVSIGRRIVIDASAYASDGSYTISCQGYSNVDSKISRIDRTGCSYTITASSQEGTASFTVHYFSSGGHTLTRAVDINIVATPSNVVFTAPTGLKVGRNRTLTIDALNHITEDSAYTVSCADATGIDSTKLTSVTRSSSGDGCTFTVDPVDSLALANQGDTTFSVLFTSTGGDTTTGTFTVNVGPDSTITYTAPTGLKAGRNRAQIVDASEYASDGSYTITCGDATNIHSRLASVTRTANTCSYTIIPISTLTLSQQGAATFNITYTSEGGHTRTVTITINIGPDSTITYTAPTGLKAGRNRTLTIDASAYVTENSAYNITCGDATNIDTTKLASVTRTANTCSYTITPISTLTQSRQGDTTFTITYTSSGGHTRTVTITINIGPSSNIVYTAPPTTGSGSLNVGRNRNITIDASAYASDSGGYTITCGDATSIDTTKLVSITRNGCSYTITPISTLTLSQQGDTTFTITYTSSGGHTRTVTITINIGPSSNIVYAAPTGLNISRSGTRTIDASAYVSDGSYTITCGNASGISSTLASVTRNGCSYSVKAGSTMGTATFSITYTSTGGHTRTVTITINIGPPSNITYTAPAGLKVGFNSTLAIDASDYVSDGPYTITCGDATSIDTAKLTSVVRDSSGGGCSFTVTSKNVQGTATFTVPYTSSGGDTATGTISVEITPISYTAPVGLKVVAGGSLNINASGYATHTGHTISCGDAKNVDSKFTSVTRADATNKPCEYTVTAGASARAGAATFTVPYTSTGGATLDATVTVTVSSITFTQPASLKVGTNRTQTIDASWYVSDGSFTISCGDATSIDTTKLASVTRAANTCSYTITPISTLTQSQQGAATFTVPYTSSGGDTYNGIVTIEVGPPSTITYTAPTGLTVGRNRTLTIDASDYVTENPAYTFTCSDASGVDATKMVVIRTGGSCAFTVDPVNSLAPGNQGDTTFSVAFTSTGGATALGTFTVNIGPDSTITYTAPTGLSIGRNRTLTIDASAYATEASQTYTITCGDATSVYIVRLLSVTRTANSCSYTVTPISTLTRSQQGDATFTVPYTSSGGATANAVITINIGPDSTITYTAPAANPAIAASGTRTLDVSIYASDGSYTISCGTITESSPLISISSQTGCDISVTAGTNTGTASISIPYVSSGGHTLTSTLTIDVGAVSDITFTAPTGLKVGFNRTQTINALDYVSDGSFTISCGDATSIDTTEISSVVRDSSGNGCSFTITPKNVQGTASFAVPYTSAGGDTYNGIVTIEVGPPSTITYTAPTGLKVGRNRTLTINASNYVTDGTYTISCGAASGVDSTKMTVTHTGSSCTFTVDPVDSLAPANQGDTTFSIPFTSEGGHSITRTITINIGPDSNITYTAPTGLKVGTNRTQTINALDYVSDGSFTISCGDATSIDTTEISSVVRDSSGNGCSFTITPKNVQGTASFAVPYTSSGGDTANGVISIEVGPASTITYTAPTGLTAGRNRTLTINASNYVTDGTYTISCGAASGVDSTKMTVTHTGSSCTFTVDPVDSLAPANQGDTTFSIPFTSEGGHSITRTITVNIGPDSNITYTAPTGLTVGRNRILTIDASNYVTDGTYAITCANATNVSSIISSITRTANSCSYTVTPISTLSPSLQGTASFQVSYTSEGGDTQNGLFSIEVGPDSTITYTAASLNVATSGQTLIDASSYVADGSYAISCGDAESIDSKLTSVARTANTCNYWITAGSASGSSSFVVPYTSAGGHTLDATVSVTIVRPLSVIVFKEPDDLELATDQTLTIDASDYASDAHGFTISCGDATSVDSKISVQRTGCDFTVTPTGTEGYADFTVPYTSSGGGTYNGVIALEIGPASAIVYTAPATLKLATNRTRTINAASYATDGSYFITCGDAASVDTKITVTRPNPNSRSCDYTITPTGATGTATFTVPYTSSGGHTTNGTISLEIAAVSTIVFTAPTGLTMTTGSTLTIDAASYATDGSYTITCADAADRDAKITRITNTGCSYEITSGETTGTATFTIPYTSLGGHAIKGQISIAITARPQNEAPVLDRQDTICASLGLEPVRHSTADRITQADTSTAFCRTPSGIICLRADRRAEVASLLINILGMDASVNNCYSSIR